jgi:hypothetical protein
MSSLTFCRVTSSRCVLTLPNVDAERLRGRLPDCSVPPTCRLIDDGKKNELNHRKRSRQTAQSEGGHEGWIERGKPEGRLPALTLTPLASCQLATDGEVSEAAPLLQLPNGPCESAPPFRTPAIEQRAHTLPHPIFNWPRSRGYFAMVLQDLGRRINAAVSDLTRAPNLDEKAGFRPPLPFRPRAPKHRGVRPRMWQRPRLAWWLAEHTG